MHDSDPTGMTVLPTLLLVDDHDVVRVGTRAMLESSFSVVGEADNTDSAIELAEERNPAVILLDVHLPGGGGVVVAQRLRKTRPEMCIVAFTVSLKRHDVRTMMSAGVDGYLTKTTRAEELPELLHQAMEGGRPVSPEVAGYFLDIDDEIKVDSVLDPLTPKERQVVHRIARGDSYREASADLGISHKTLESHMGNIFKKLGVASRHQLAARVAAPLIHPDSEY